MGVLGLYDWKGVGIEETSRIYKNGGFGIRTWEIEGSWWEEKRQN